MYFASKDPLLTSSIFALKFFCFSQLSKLKSTWSIDWRYGPLSALLWAFLNMWEDTYSIFGRFFRDYFDFLRSIDLFKLVLSFLISLCILRHASLTKFSRFVRYFFKISSLLLLIYFSIWSSKISFLFSFFSVDYKELTSFNCLSLTLRDWNLLL